MSSLVSMPSVWPRSIMRFKVRYNMVYTKHIVPERNGVGRSETIRGVVEDLLRRHLITDGVVHIHVERLLGFGQFLPEEDALSSKGMEHGASLSGQKFGVGISNLFFAVVDPVILARAKKCVLALKV